MLVGLAIAAACGCWLWKRHHSFRHRSWSPEIVEDFTSSDRGSSVSWYSPPRYSRSGSFVQALPPPYNEVNTYIYIYIHNIDAIFTFFDIIYIVYLLGYSQTKPISFSHWIR